MTVKMLRKILKLTAGAFVVATALVVAMVILFPAEEDELRDITTTVTNVPEVSNNNDPAQSNIDYSALLMSDNPDAQLAEAVTLKEIKEKFILLGTIYSKNNSDKNYAVIQMLEPRSKQVLKKAGEFVNDYPILSIEPDRVVILADGKEVILQPEKYQYATKPSTSPIKVLPSTVTNASNDEDLDKLIKDGKFDVEAFKQKDLLDRAKKKPKPQIVLPTEEPPAQQAKETSQVFTLENII